MEEEEYQKKIYKSDDTKSVQDYLKTDTTSSGLFFFPVKIPDELFLQVLRVDGPKVWIVLCIISSSLGLHSE
jgi:hypothetical protein